MLLPVTRYFDKKDFINIIALILIWVLAVILINPIGNFPLDDDWRYGKTVKHLLESGVYELADDGAPSLFAQVIWGTLFCLPFGFSFTALRFSTLVLGLAGVIAIYGILREMGVKKALSFHGALLVAVNPIYFLLSNTFMTDIPFLSFASISFYFFIRVLHRQTFAEIAVAIFFACAATLTRQIGIAIPISFAVAYLFKAKGDSNISPALYPASRYRRILLHIIITMTPSIIVFGSLITYIKILQATGTLPKEAGIECIHIMLIKKALQHFTPVILNVLRNTVAIFAYLGLFLLPFLLIGGNCRWEQLSRRERIIIISADFLFMLTAAEVIIHQKKLMPFQQFGGNIIENFRLGPSLLKDVFIMGKHNLPRAPWLFWLIVTIAGIAGGLLLLRLVVSSFLKIFRSPGSESDQMRRLITIMAILAMLLLYAPVVLLDYMFDRYIMAFLPPVVIILAAQNWYPSSNQKRWAVPIAAAVMVLLTVFSICGTHDYLSWNKARWAALNYLTDGKGISPYIIDGGFEFNGWHLYGGVNLPRDQGVQWWIDKEFRLNKKDEYMVCFGNLKRYDPIEKFEYRRWLPPHSASLSVLKKNNEPEQFKIYFQNGCGDFYYWELDKQGNCVHVGDVIGGQQPGWSIAGYNDINKDTMNDIVLRYDFSAFSAIGTWFLDGGELQSVNLVGRIDRNCTIIGIEDIDGDLTVILFYGIHASGS
jgi:hypothetical protein